MSSSLYWLIDTRNYTHDNPQVSSLGQLSSHGFGDEKVQYKVKFFSPSVEGIVAPVQLFASVLLWGKLSLGFFCPWRSLQCGEH